MNRLKLKPCLLLLLYFLLPPLGIFFICKNQQLCEKMKGWLAAIASAAYIILLIFCVQSAVVQNQIPASASEDTTYHANNSKPKDNLEDSSTILDYVQKILTGDPDTAAYLADVTPLPDEGFEVSIQCNGNEFATLSKCQLTANKIISRFYTSVELDSGDISLIEINYISGNELKYIISLREVYKYSRDSFASHLIITTLGSEAASIPISEAVPVDVTQAAAPEPEGASEKPPQAPVNNSQPELKSSGTIALISITSPIATGKIATVTVKGKSNTEYDIKVKYSSSVSSAKGLENKFSDGSGTVSWSWRIGAKTKPGTFSVTITGGGDTLVIPISITG